MAGVQIPHSNADKVNGKKKTANCSGPTQPPAPNAHTAEWIIAVATVIYAFFAIFQWFALRKQAEIANRTLLLMQRPRLVVRNLSIREPLPEFHTQPLVLFNSSVPVKGQFYVGNVGGSPAEIRESECSILLTQEKLPMERPYEGRPGNNPVTGKLSPGESQRGTFWTPPTKKYRGDIISEDKARRADMVTLGGGTGGWNIYALGWIEYVDDLKIIRQTVFCRKYDIHKRRFGAIDDPDYEQAE